MSMTDSGSSQGQPGTGANDTNLQNSTEGENHSVGTDSTQGGSQEFDNPFLSTVEEADREIVSKYIKKWDAGVNRRFQDLHNEYRPYKDLGDPETLQQAVQLMTIFEQRPEDIYKMLHEQYGQRQQPNYQQQQFGPGFQQQPGNQSLQQPYGDIYSSLPEELAPLAPLFQQQQQQFQQVQQTYDTRFTNVEKALNTMGQYLLGQMNTSKQSQEDQELEKYMGLLKDEFGDFDEQYVLTMMNNGMSGEQAVQAFQKMIQERVNGSRQSQPNMPVLNGGGSAPVQTPNVTELSRKQTQDLVADVLRRANES